MYLLPEREQRAGSVLLFLFFWLFWLLRRTGCVLRRFVEGVVPRVLRHLQLSTECTSTIPVTCQDSFTHGGAELGDLAFQSFCCFTHRADFSGSG
jgi:hypothetical protein